MALYVEKFDAELVQGDCFTLSFSCDSAADKFNKFDLVEYKLFVQYYSKRKTEFRHHVSFRFDRKFYGAICKSKFANLIHDDVSIVVELESDGMIDCWKIHLPKQQFNRKDFLFPLRHVKINVKQVSIIQKPKPKPKTKSSFKSPKLSRKESQKTVAEFKKKLIQQDPLYEIPREVRSLYRNGFLYRMPEPAPKGLGKGRSKKSGGGKNLNAKYVGSINQGGLFTPK